MPMRHLITAIVICFYTIGLAQAQDTLDAVIADYEALLADLDPDERARQTGELATGWPDTSPAAAASEQARRTELLARLEALEVDEQRALDVAILDFILDTSVELGAFDSARVPFTGDSGFHSYPLFVARQTRLTNAVGAEAYIARLEALPAYFDQQIANMRRGLAEGYTAASDPTATVIEQLGELAGHAPEDSPLYGPFAGLPDSLDGADALKARGAAAVATAIASFGDVLAFMEAEYAPATRAEAGIGSLEGGKAYYQAVLRQHTTRSELTPERVHEIGQAEVARIRAEMEDIIAETGFEGSFAEFLEFLRTDPQFYAKTPEELLEKASRISKRLDAVLPQYFGKLPRLPYGVIPVPAAIAPGYTTGRYSPGDAESGLSGSYLVNTYRLDQRPLYELPALSAHEAVPGHHLQIALAQELEDRPRFRQSYYATAFGEGWGLYSERIAGEAGIYQTPYERFGALSYEMWRACRLVADTGLHWYGWTREEAERCFRENSALAELNIKTEVTRYIGWPGQALGYKIGEITIRELRAEAEAALGEDFDIRAFHDTVLEEGALPLDLLEARVRAWVAEVQSGSD